MQISGPTIVRRQLGRRLRQARHQAGKTIEDVHTSGVVSKATLHRYESGRAAVTPGSALELSLLYGLDQATTKELYDLAVGSQQRGWWESGDSSAVTGLGLIIGLQSVATSINIFEPNVIPGLLQTADYARAVERAYLPVADEELVEARVAFRLKRQEMLFTRKPAVELRVVLGPGVLITEVGGPEVMKGQFEHFRELTRTGHVDIRVLTGQGGAHAAMTGWFSLMTYDDPDDPAVVYVGSVAGGSYYELPEQVEHYIQIFDSVFGQGVPLEEYQR